MKLSKFAAFAGVCIAVLYASASFAETPTKVRIGTPDQSLGPNPSAGPSTLTLVYVRKLFDEEFAKDGIKIEWSFLKGAGPAVNEALANNQLDFVYLGDLAAIIGKANGLPTRFLAGTRGSNTFLAVTPESGIKAVQDLKGKRVALFKGTAHQLSFDRVVAGAGLTERDLQVINLDWNAGIAALAAKQVDANWGFVSVLALREKGLANIPISTKQLPRTSTTQAGLLGRAAFISEQPDLTARLVKRWVQAAHWASQPEHKEEFLKVTAEQGNLPIQFANAEYEGDDLKFRQSPRLDPFLLKSLQGSADQAKELNLVRKPFEVDAWVEPRFVEQAIKDLGLDNYWPLFDVEGRPPER